MALFCTDVDVIGRGQVQRTTITHNTHTHTCRDFEAFKDVMLSYKREQTQDGMGFSVQVSCLQIINKA